MAFFAALILAITLVAVAQEDDIAEYANLDQLGHVIDSFVAGEEIEGLTIDAAGDATSAIVRQFQITTNLVSGPTRGKADIEFVPVGFSQGSTTDLDNLEAQFDGTIGENDIVPPLAPWSRVGDEIDVSAIFEGWTAYGDRGPIDGPIIINPAVQTIWGVELTDSIDGTCAETRFVGRTWISQGVGGAPDPLFTAEGLADSYRGNSHEALAGNGGRLVQFQCTSQGSVAWAQRMKDDGTVRSFGPTGVIALVKDQFVVFFIWVEQLDGRLDQVFYASPPGGGQVVVSEVESESLLLLPNPYQQYPTRISFIVDGDEQASDDTARHLLYDGTTASGVRIQTGGGCSVSDREFFIIAIESAINGGYMRSRSLPTTISQSGDELVFVTKHPSGAEETESLNLETGEVEIETSTGCATTGTALVNGEPIVGESAANDTEEDADDDSTSEAGGESDTTGENEDSGISWGPIFIALILVAALAVYTVTRNRTKKDCRPEEQALDAATRAASLAHKDATEKETAVQEAIMSDGSKEAIAKARATADKAHAAAEVAMDTYRQARTVYQDCKGAADLGDEMDPSDPGVGTTRTRADTPETDPEPEDGDTPSDPESPSVYGEVNDPVDPDDCRTSPDEVRPDAALPPTEFIVPVGNVVIRSSMRSWNRVMGGPTGLTAAGFAAISDSELDEALTDFDNQSRVVQIHPEIKRQKITVTCGYVWTCKTGQWVNTFEIATASTTKVDLSPLKVGNKKDSPSKDNAKVHIQEAQTKLNQLLEEQDAYNNFTCD